MITRHATPDLVCTCGNTPRGDGFYPCNSAGEELEPTLASEWLGLYLCARCYSLHTFEGGEK